MIILIKLVKPFLTLFTTLLLFLVLLNACSTISVKSIEVNRVSTYSKNPIKITENIDVLKTAYNDGNYVANSIKDLLIEQDTLIVLNNEKAQFSYYLENITDKEIEVSINSSATAIVVYRLLPVSDWYSEGNNRPYMEFYPDALFRINPLLLENGLKLNPKERIQLFIETELKGTGVQDVDVQFKTNQDQLINTRITVNKLKVATPSSSFNSIIFNQINLQSGSGVLDTWQETGFTHLQVNYIPTVIFDKYGNPTTNEINHKTSNSTGFRNTAYPWIRKGGTVLLFWEPRYQKLALTASGNYLKPFTTEWLNAFKNLIHIIRQDLIKKYSSTTHDQIVLYLADEVTRLRKKDELNGYKKLSTFIEREIPNLKILLTFGYYSDKSIVDSFEGIDIYVPHILMPDKREIKGVYISPQSVFQSAKIFNNEKWMYSIEAGKKAPLYKFRALPVIAAAQGYKGYSWYSFADHAGSTWYAADGKRLDYSLYYHREPKNPIYNYWSDRLVTQDYLTRTLRLKAIKKGLVDAKIVRWLIESKHHFKKEDVSIINNLLKKLQNIDIESRSESSLNESSVYNMPVSSEKLRLLYSRLKTDYKL